MAGPQAVKKATSPEKTSYPPLRVKLYNIMCAIDRIGKDATNKKQGYDYASEKVIKEEFHKQFVEHRVLFCLDASNARTVDSLTSSGPGKLTFADFKYGLLDVDSEEEIGGTFVGSGNGRDDKGLYAAITGCIKYVLTSNFLIPTGDDPEADKNDIPSGRKSGEIPSIPKTTAPAADPEKKKKAEAAMIAGKIKATAVQDTSSATAIAFHFGKPTGDKISAADAARATKAFANLDEPVTSDELALISGLAVTDWSENIKQNALAAYNNLITGQEKKADMFNGIL